MTAAGRPTMGLFLLGFVVGVVVGVGGLAGASLLYFRSMTSRGDWPSL